VLAERLGHHVLDDVVDLRLLIVAAEDEADAHAGGPVGLFVGVGLAGDPDDFPLQLGLLFASGEREDEDELGADVERLRRADERQILRKWGWGSPQAADFVRVTV
jgi:hypothetical protein